MKFKIGQVIKFQQNRKIQAEGGKTLTVKKGDTARIIKKVDEKSAEIVYLTGEAKGKSQIVTMEVENDIDEEAMAKKIMDMLK